MGKTGAYNHDLDRAIIRGVQNAACLYFQDSIQEEAGK